MVNKSNLLAIGVGIIVAFLLGYVVGQKGVFSSGEDKSPSDQQKVKENPMESHLVPTGDLDDPSNWETFQSEKLPIEFQYPKGWYVSEMDSQNPDPKSGEDQITISNYNQDDINGSGVGLTQKFIKINIFTINNKPNLSSWANELGFSSYEKVSVGKLIGLKQKNYFVGPEQASRDNPRYLNDLIIFTDGKTGYQISYSPQSSDWKDVFDKILATVNFK